MGQTGHYDVIIIGTGAGGGTLKSVVPELTAIA